MRLPVTKLLRPPALACLLALPLASARAADHGDVVFTHADQSLLVRDQTALDDNAAVGVIDVLAGPFAGGAISDGSPMRVAGIRCAQTIVAGGSFTVELSGIQGDGVVRNGGAALEDFTVECLWRLDSGDEPVGQTWNASVMLTAEASDAGGGSVHVPDISWFMGIEPVPFVLAVDPPPITPPVDVDGPCPVTGSAQPCAIGPVEASAPGPAVAPTLVGTTLEVRLGPNDELQLGETASATLVATAPAPLPLWLAFGLALALALGALPFLTGRSAQP